MKIKIFYYFVYYFIFSERIQNNKISAEKHILCYLWFVGHQTGSYRDIADRFGITINALHTVITRVTDFILALAHNIIKYPTDLEKEQTSNFCLQRKGFPNIIGKYIRVYSHIFNVKYFAH